MTTSYADPPPRPKLEPHPMAERWHAYALHLERVIVECMGDDSPERERHIFTDTPAKMEFIVTQLRECWMENPMAKLCDDHVLLNGLFPEDAIPDSEQNPAWIEMRRIVREAGEQP